MRYAVVGLGHIAQVAVLPAFAHARRNSELVALVSDDAEKRRALARRYRVPHAWSYEDYERCLQSGDVDAVYIALPNSLHREYAERAARCGMHVLVEKPMAVTATECRSMIATARKHRVKLMVAYRLHFEAGTLRAVKLARAGTLGDLKLFASVFTMQARGGNIRLDAELGGGPLYDIGIYCINAARMLFAAEPKSVLATVKRRDAIALRGGGGDGERHTALPRQPPGHLHLQLRRGRCVRLSSGRDEGHPADGPRL